MIKVQLSQIQALAPDMVAQYREAFGSPNVADILAKYGISENPLRVCHFLAQILAETGGLALLRESLNYSPERLQQVWPSRFPTWEIASEYAHNEQKLGNFVYGGRLGNVDPGDGYLYRGRGLLQITGRNAYTRFGAQLNIPLVTQPDLAFDPAYCLEIAAAEWAVSGVPPRSCNELADADDIRGVTRAINGGEIGLNDRMYWLQRTKEIWLAAGMQTAVASLSSHAQALSNGATSAAPGDPRISSAAGGAAPVVQPASLVEGHAADGRTMNAQEALLYGNLVQAAYTMFKLNPGNLTPPQSPDFPPGYRLVAWVNMQDFILAPTGPVFYGIVAQSVTDATQFVLALRGTSNGEEWWDDVNAAVRTPFKISGCGSVGAGFARIYDTLEVIERQPPESLAASPVRSLRAAGGLAEQMSALVRHHVPATIAQATMFPAQASVAITGHSLGAALATLYAMENAHTNQIRNPTICTFASPLVGDATFAGVFNKLGLTSWRIVNAPDVVPMLPPAILGFVHVDTIQPFDSRGTVKSSFSCWHALATYLGLIDPTKQKQPGADCQLASLPAPPPRPVAAVSPMAPRALDGPLQASPGRRPVAIDIYHGDNVEDYPGPLGGFARVKADGIAFLIHKATEGLTEVDFRYHARRAAWMDGIPIAVTDVDGTALQLAPRFAAYHFFHGQDPEGEAQHFLANAQLQPGDDAVIDWEAVGASGYQPSADAVDAFCNVVERVLGFPIIVYSGNVAKEQLRGRDPRFAKRRLWLASYGRTFTIQQSWDYPWLWQDNGDIYGPGPNRIPGIDGYCDNSTVVGPMTIKQLYEQWGGGTAKALLVAGAGGDTSGGGVRLRSSLSTGAKPKKRKIAGYGWKPDLPDQRDHSYAVPSAILQNITPSVDLRPLCPPVYAQGQIGSCTANAIAAALEFDMMKQKLLDFTPSRLFIYFNERDIEGTVGSDAGAYIRDGIKSVASQGICPENSIPGVPPESVWPYVGLPPLPGGTFAPGAAAAETPRDDCYAYAKMHKAISYQAVDQNLADMRGCLSSGYPFVFGFTVYESFESDVVAKSGNVPMPGADEAMRGGHAVLAVGYDDKANVFICRNSWGPDWGTAGYFYMPYAYLLDSNLSADFWTIRVVS